MKSQFFYLDFDEGNHVNYHGELSEISGFNVGGANLIEKQIAEQNSRFSADITFSATNQLPEEEYSTIFVDSNNVFESQPIDEPELPPEPNPGETPTPAAPINQTLILSGETPEHNGAWLQQNDQYIKMEILPGGVAKSTVISNEGIQNVRGGLAKDTTILGEGKQEVFANGTASKTVISNGGIQNVSGGATDGTTIFAGGKQVVFDNGIASNSFIRGGVQIVSSGGSANSTVIYNGTQNVFFTVLSTTLSGGVQNVFRDATTDSTFISSGGNQVIFDGGRAYSTNIRGGIQTISSGGSAITAVLSQGIQHIKSGGVTNDAQINGGTQQISSGGVANDAKINASGTQVVEAGGLASNATINASGTQVVEAGGLATEAIIQSGGEQIVLAGGVASGTHLSVGTLTVKSGGSAIGITQGIGGIITHVDGNDNKTVVTGSVFSQDESSQDEFSLRNGHADNFTLNEGGSQFVFNGGIANNTKIDRGYQLVSSGGITNHTSAINNGCQDVISSGTANFTKLLLSGMQRVSAGGITNDTIIDAEGKQLVLDGGLANDTTISASTIRDGIGKQEISSGGVAKGTKIIIGNQTVFDGGIASNTTIFDAPRLATQTISSGGTAEHTTISGGIQTVDIGGIANSTTIAGGLQTVNIGGIANYTNLQEGRQRVLGVASNTLVAGGDLEVFEGGLVVSTLISSGSIMMVGNGGSALHVIQEVNAALFCYITGNNRRTLISGTNALGKEFSLKDGVANNFAIYQGGGLYMESGGVANSTVISSGGVVVASGGMMNATEIFAYGLHGVSGGGIANNTLIHTLGTQGILNATANSTVLHGGVQVVLENGVTNSTNILDQGNQLVQNGGITSETLISSGGNQLVQQGGVANETLISSGGNQLVEQDGVANETLISSGGNQLVKQGGVANGTTVMAGGTLTVNGGMLTGVTTLGGVMVVSQANTDVNNGSIVYNLTQPQTAKFILIDNLANLVNVASYTVSVKASQGGHYVLAGGAGGFDVPIHLVIDGVNFGEMSLNNSLVCNERKYQLALDDNQLLSLQIHTEEEQSTCVTLKTDTTSGNDFQYSLREAIRYRVFSERNLPVTFDSQLNGFEIVLSQNLHLGIEELTLLGNGAEQTIIRGQGDAALIVENTENLTLQKLSLHNATIHSGAVLNLADDVTLTGNFALAGIITTDGVVNASGASLTMELKPQDANAPVRIDQWANISSVAALTIAMDDSIPQGNYRLIGGAAGFSENITLCVGGENLGEFRYNSIDGTYNLLKKSWNEYSLSIKDGVLVMEWVNKDIILGNGETSTGDIINNSESPHMTVGNGGMASGTQINSGGAQDVYSGGNASGSIVSSGGTQIIHSGGGVTDGIMNGGTQIVSGGVASNTLLSGGTQIISGGVASNTLLSGGTQTIASNGTAEQTVVHSDGRQHVSEGGVAKNTIVESGGMQIISSGASAHLTVISANAVQHISSGGIATSGLVMKNGNQVVSAGGTAIHAEIIGGMQTLRSGGVAQNTIVKSNGIQRVLDNARASATVVTTYGTQAVHSGGVAVDTIVKLGGLQHVSGAGITSTTFASAGGTQHIEAGGIAKNTVVRSGGTQHLASGASAHASIISSGGILSVERGGILSGEISIGGTLVTTGAVTLASDTTITLAVNGHSPGEPVMIDSLANVSGANLVISVNSDLAPGIYSLAGNAAKFTGSISIRNVNGIKYGMLQPGGAGVTAGSHVYKLISAHGNLALQVSNVIPPVYSNDFSGNITAENYKLTFGSEALADGRYTIAGNFGEMNARFSIVSEAGKKIASGTVRKGVVKFKEKLIEAGNYTIVFESSDRGRTGGDFTLTLNGALYTEGDNGDDWTNVKTLGAAGLHADYSLGSITATGPVLTEWVGFGDAVDYRKFTLESGANLSLNLFADDQAKLTIYQLIENRNGSFRLKAIRNVSVNAKNPSKTLTRLLEAGDYYMGISTNTAKKGGDVSYTITVEMETTTFYTEGDNTDDWTNMKTVGAAGLSADHNLGEVTAAKELFSDWIGFGDAVDYRKFTLKNGANLSLTLTATGQAKCTIYQLIENRNGTFRLKAIRNVSVNTNTPSRDLTRLLEAGDYYIEVTTNTAKRGGSVNYDLSVNSNSIFYSSGKNADDDYTQLSDAYKLRLDHGGEVKFSDWVGFGDAVDYREITFAADGTCIFQISGLEDTVKLTLYQQKNGKLRRLDSETVKSREIDDWEVQAGTYYLGIESTTAKKGGGTDYNLQLNFYPGFDLDDAYSHFAATNLTNQEDTPGSLGMLA